MKWMKPQNCRQLNINYIFIVTSIDSHQSSVNAYGETKERLHNLKWSRINLSDKKRYDDDGWRRVKTKQQANALKLMSDWMRFDALTHTHSHFACKASFKSISSRRINVSTSKHVMSCFDFLMISLYFAYSCGVWCCGRLRWLMAFCLNDGFSHGIRVRFACAQRNEQQKMKNEY